MIKNSLIDDFGCTIVKITYDEWLAYQELDFFGFGGEPSELFDKIPSLQSYINTVELIKVGRSLYKVNGQRRKEAWSSGALPKPTTLTALIYDVSKSDFSKLCTESKEHFLKTLPQNEIVKLAYSDLGLNFTSERLRHGLITEALNIALRGRQRPLQDKRLAKEREDINIKKAVNVFREELKTLDKLSLSKDIFTVGVFAGALIMLGLNKPIIDFIVCLNDRKTESKDEVLTDPVGSLLKIIWRNKISHKNDPRRMSIDLCKKTIQAMSLWLEGRESSKYWRTRDLTGLSIEPLILELKRLKMIHAERDL